MVVAAVKRQQLTSSPLPTEIKGIEPTSLSHPLEGEEGRGGEERERRGKGEGKGREMGEKEKISV